MTVLQAFFLGVLQGLTEFLPISSSGHLVLAEKVLAVPIDGRSLQGFDVLLHGGTLVALLVSYSSFWSSTLVSAVQGRSKAVRILSLIALATISGGIVGALFEEYIAHAFRALPTLGWSFLLTAAVLLVAEKVSRNSGRQQWQRMAPVHALAIGSAQALALIPGISRSGLTIAAGLLLRLSRQEALDFSFIIAVPILIGANVFTLLSLRGGGVTFPPFAVVVTGVLSSFVVSICTVHILRSTIAKLNVGWFALYLVPLALFLIGYR